MAKGFRPVQRDQPFLLPPDMREWLPAGHLAWFVIDVVQALDLSRFAARPGRSAAGRAAYDPAVLLGLLAYGYATGVRSSRRIERACREDVAFRVICAQDVPDHATIARFRREHFADGAAMGHLFGQVLVLAARAGMGKLGLIALDGTKIAANASKDANRREARLRELAGQILAEAEEADAAEDALFGDARGDELPPELADPVTRRDRIAAALASLEAENRAAARAQEEKAARQAAELAAREEELGRRIAAQQAKCDDYAARSAASIAATGRGLAREGRPVPPGEHVKIQRDLARLEQARQRAAAPPPERPAPVRNITDPDSRLMPLRGGGFAQGYNAQAVRSSDGLVTACCVTSSTTDYASFEPMMRQAQAASALIRARARGPLHRRRAKIGTVLADAGYRSHANLTCPGPDRLIATGKHRDLEKAARNPAGPPPPAGLSPAAAMTARLATPQGITAYRQRGPIAETLFADTKHNRGFRRFSMRGLKRANGEWAFTSTITNLLAIRAKLTPA
jgi:transposase